MYIYIMHIRFHVEHNKKNKKTWNYELNGSLQERDYELNGSLQERDYELNGPYRRGTKF